MKKLISVLIISVMLLTAAACICSSSGSAQTARGELAVVYDRELTKELLAYFQANQGVTVTGVLLNDETDYETLAGSVALIKDEAFAEKLKALGWTETQNWTDAQKEANAAMFNFIVLTAPNITDSGKVAGKYLTDWLVGDGAYERTIRTASGGCSCSQKETTVTMTSDAPALFKSGAFSELVTP